MEQGFIHYESLMKVAMAAFILSTIYEAIKTRMAVDWEAMTPLAKRIMGYVFNVLSAGLLWFTAANALPGFDADVPGVGRILTCIAGGLGQKLVYDIWSQKPKPPEL